MDAMKPATRVPQEVIEETERRLENRRTIREDNIRNIREGNWLEADTPDRVQERLERLGFTLESPQATEFIERILGKNNLLDMSFVKLCLWVSKSVGRILLQAASGAIRPNGTGFMVSPHLLLTNNHVLFSRNEASNSLVEFDFELGPNGLQLPSAIFNLQPERFFITDKRLDYTLVAVSQNASNGTALGSFRWLRLVEDEGKILNGEPVNIIQHPDGKSKKLTLRDNRLVDTLGDFLHYEADTEGGSSGSPTFNEQWEVVSLHHSGIPKKDDQGNILTKLGTIWTPDMGESEIEWLFNEGVRISPILANVREQNLTTDEQKVLRDEIFTSRPPLP